MSQVALRPSELRLSPEVGNQTATTARRKRRGAASNNSKDYNPYGNPKRSLRSQRRYKALLKTGNKQIQRELGLKR